MKRIVSRHTMPLRMVLLGLCLAQQPSVWATSEAGTPTHSDSRADPSGLPADVQPWWPSRYGADDQLGTLNEITPEVVRETTVVPSLVAPLIPPKLDELLY